MSTGTFYTKLTLVFICVDFGVNLPNLRRCHQVGKPPTLSFSQLNKNTRGVRTMTEASVTLTDSDAAKLDSRRNKRWFPLGESLMFRSFGT